MTKSRFPRSPDTETTPSSCADRREVVIGGAAFTAVLAAGGDVGFAATEDAAKLEVQPGDRFEFVKGELKGQLVRPELLSFEEKQIEIFPVDAATGVMRKGNRLNRAMVIRLDPGEMDDATRAAAAEGVLIYSAICTHKGCTIKSWMKKERHLQCHCHLSEFDALASGDVRRGPSKHQLPMVPVAVDDEGFIVATAGFNKAPGGKTK